MSLLSPLRVRSLFFFDWKAAEFFIAAYWAKCGLALDWFNNGIDVHTEISKRLLGKSQISKEERKISKVVTFANYLWL